MIPPVTTPAAPPAVQTTTMQYNPFSVPRRFFLFPLPARICIGGHWRPVAIYRQGASTMPKAILLINPLGLTIHAADRISKPSKKPLPSRPVDPVVLVSHCNFSCTVAAGLGWGKHESCLRLAHLPLFWHPHISSYPTQYSLPDAVDCH